MKKAIYCGSFDPITNGHLWVITEASKIFDKVIVAIATNSEKQGMFSTQERLDLLHNSLVNLKNIEIVEISKKYVATYAKENNIKFMIRGIRNNQDLDYEKGVQSINQQINPDLSIIYLIPPEKLTHVSSSTVKGLLNHPGWQEIVQKLVPYPVVFLILMKDHHQNWKSFCGGMENEWKTKIFKFLLEPHRHYHNLQHIAELFKNLSQVGLKGSDLNSLQAAIWFHDVIYDPKSKTNEDDSAELLIQFNKERNTLSSDELKKAIEMIKATKNHLEYNTDDPAINLFLDLDLSILGSSEERFNEYCEQIRKEYSFVPEDIYKIERKKILLKFLNTKFLFKTQWGFDKFEAQARKNLTKAISSI